MKKFIAALILVILFIFGGLSLLFNTDSGKAFLLSESRKRVEESTGFQFRVESFSAKLPFHVIFKGLSLEKEGIEVLRAEKGELILSLSDLFYKKNIVRKLHLENGFVKEELLNFAKGGRGVLTVKEFSLKEFYIGHLESPIDLKGEFCLEEQFSQMKTDIMIDNTNFLGEVKANLDHLTVDLEVKEPEFGFLTKKLALKTHAPFTLRTTLSGSLESWMKKALSKGGVLSGELTFNYPNLEVLSDLRIDDENLVTLSKVTALHNDFKLNGYLSFDRDLTIKKGGISLSSDLFKIESEVGGSLQHMTVSGNLFTPQFGAIGLSVLTNLANDQIEADIKLDSSFYGGELFLYTKQQADWLASLKTWPFGFSYKSNALDCEGRGVWKLTQESFMVMIESCEGEFMNHSIALKEPIVLREKELSPLLFNLENGSLSIVVDDFENLHTTTKGVKLPFSLVQKFLPKLPLEAEVSLNATLFGDPSKLQGDIELELEKIKILDEMFSKLPFLRANCRAKLKDHSIECLGHILGIGPDAVKLEASLPYNCELSPSLLKSRGETPFFAKFTASGELAPYLQLLYTDTTQITGKTDIAIEVRGPIETPHIIGKARLYEASFESLELGTSFQNIYADFEGEGNQIVIQSFTGKTDGQQTLAGSGKITLSSEKQFPFDLKVSLRKAPFLQLDSAKIATTGDIRVTGNLKGSKVTGELLVDQAEFTLPKQLPTAIDQVEVSYINQGEEEKIPTSYKTKKPNWPIALDINFKSQATTKILGKDLTSTWKADVILKGSPEALTLYGDLFAIDGQYKMNGQIFRIDQGNIHLNGSFSKNTTLNVIAYQDIDNIRAEILLKGALQNPHVTFQSDPPLAAQEVLSLLLFKKALPDLSSYEGTQLKQTFSSLTSQTEGPNFLSKLREAIGIDRIDITQNQTVDVNEVSVRLGKYFYPGFYLFYNQTIPSDGKKLALEANLMKNLKLEAEVGDDTQGQVMLKWRHDY
jgi:hypothetical protein